MASILEFVKNWQRDHDQYKIIEKHVETLYSKRIDFTLQSRIKEASSLETKSRNRSMKYESAVQNVRDIKENTDRKFQHQRSKEGAKCWFEKNSRFQGYIQCASFLFNTASFPEDELSNVGISLWRFGSCRWWWMSSWSPIRSRSVRPFNHIERRFKVLTTRNFHCSACGWVWIRVNKIKSSIVLSKKEFERPRLAWTSVTQCNHL